ncbi:DUF397 domain-containing protein [Nocardia sp. BMG51109]|uniref:DUF397 domain-containing protein n=1 Tax=Nocardia sp. BMG51109 TaxID=1056816 RepID=UPI000466A693|nr:DUF397 domain-containing protein [Nocardia sp. BMG51109]
MSTAAPHSDAGFVTPSRSGANSACVEVAHVGDAVLIRDSKYTGPPGEQPAISVPAAHWQEFLDLVLSAGSGNIGGAVEVALHPNGGATLVGNNAALVYTADEWDAFAKGIAGGEFDLR